MKIKTIIISTFLPLAAIAIIFTSCAKNSNYVRGDARVRVFQASVLDTTQNFLLDSLAFGNATVYGSNSSYIVVEGYDDERKNLHSLVSRNINAATNLAVLRDQMFNIGKNYSVFLTRETPTSTPKLISYQDTVSINTEVAKLVFINLGYTLESRVVIKDEGKGFDDFNLGYGGRVTKNVKVNKATKISFALVNPIAAAPAVASIDSLTISKGRVYTVLIDGNKLKYLQKRLVDSSNQ